MRRLLRALWRQVPWPLAVMAAGGVACFAVTVLLVAGVGVRSAPLLTADEILIGVVYLLVGVAVLRAQPRDRVFDVDDQVDIKFMRPLPRRLRTVVFVASVAGLLVGWSGMFAKPVAGAGERAVATVALAGVVAGMATYMFGKGLAEQALLREKADHLRGRQRMAEMAAARAVQVARHPVPDPDAAVRRRIAEREGTLAQRVVPVPRQDTEPEI